MSEMLIKKVDNINTLCTKCGKLIKKGFKFELVISSKKVEMLLCKKCKNKNIETLVNYFCGKNPKKKTRYEMIQ